MGRDGPPPASDLVRAAGGLVVRPGAGGTEVLVVHRPRYDDWSLPKGKVGPGEREADTARREVAEETGLACTLGVEVGVTRYRDRHGRRKQVRYWLMTPGSGAFTPNDEVDEIRWCRIPDALGLLSYEYDRALVSGIERDG